MTAGENTPRRDFFATTPGVIVGALITCFLWGSAFPCIKIGYGLFSIEQSDTASQLVFAGTRFFFSGVLVIVFMSILRGRPLLPRKSSVRPIITLSLFQTTLQYLFFYPGLSRAAGVSASIMEASATFLAILLGALVFRQERLTARKLVGCAVGFAGVILVNLGGSGGFGFSLLGEGFIFLSALAGAISTCLIRIFSADEDPVMLSGWQFMVGGLTLLAVGLGMGGSLRPNGPASICLLAYMAFLSACAYSLWSMLLQRNPISRVAIFGFTNPVFGVVLSAILLGEGQFMNPLRYVVALVLVSAGIIIVNRQKAEGVGEKPAPATGEGN